MAGNAQTDPSLMDVINNYEERRRPKTAFLLFVADQREKMMRDNPNLSLSKITFLAKIKWGRLPKEQQMIY